VREVDEIISKIREIRGKLEAYLETKREEEEKRIQELNDIRAELEKLDKFVDDNFVECIKEKP